MKWKLDVDILICLEHSKLLNGDTSEFCLEVKTDFVRLESLVATATYSWA